VLLNNPLITSNAIPVITPARRLADWDWVRPAVLATAASRHSRASKIAH
jgi:hypothetical protein